MRTDDATKLRSIRFVLLGGAAATLLAGALAVDRLVYRSIDERRANLVSRAAELRAVLDDAASVRETNRQLKQRHHEIEEKAASFRQRIPDEPRESDFLGQLSQLARDVSLQVREYRPGVAVARESYSQMEVVLSCEGSYESLCKFLESMARLPRLMSVTRLEIAAQPDANTYPMTMTLLIYFGSGSDTRATKKV